MRTSSPEQARPGVIKPAKVTLVSILQKIDADNERNLKSGHHCHAGRIGMKSRSKLKHFD